MPPLRLNLSNTADKLEQIIDTIGRLISWLALMMVVIMFAVVVLRYAFDLGWIAMQESVSFMHGILIMLGAAFTLRYDAHVRVDIFYQNWGIKGQAIVNLLGTLTFLIPLSLLILWTSYPYVMDSWSIHEGSPQTGGLPGIYLIKTMIPLMAVTLLIQAAAVCCRSLSVLCDKGLSNNRETERN